MNAVIITVLVIAVIAAGIWFALRAFKSKIASAAGDMAQLMQQGAEARARITATDRRRMARGEFEYFVTYSFTTRDHQEVSKELRVSASRFDDYQQGEEIAIVYLPDDPSVSVTRDMLGQVQKAGMS